MKFEEYCFKKEVNEMAVQLAEEGEDGTFLMEWLIFHYPERAQKMKLMEAVPMLGAGYQVKGDPEMRVVEPEPKPQMTSAVRNLDKIMGFFNRLKDVIDQEYEDAISRGDLQHRWGELWGSDRELRQYIEDNLNELGSYFGTKDIDSILKQTPRVASRKNVLTVKERKDPSLQSFVPVLQGLIQAYDRAKKQKTAGREQTGMEAHYNGLKDAVERLKQDVAYFRELFSAHTEGWRVPAKAFRNLKVQYVPEGGIKQRHPSPEYKTRRI